MIDGWDEDDPVDAAALAWLRERPGTPVEGIGIVTRVWQLAKLFGEDRRRILAAAGADPAILDLLSVLRRAGAPYRLTTRELTERTRVTAGAISQRIARGKLCIGPAGGCRGRVTRRRRQPHPGRTRTGRGSRRPGPSREAELITSLAPSQRAVLTELLRLLLNDVHEQVGVRRHTPAGSS